MLLNKVLFFLLILVSILSADENNRYWVYFTDKNISSLSDSRDLSTSRISDRAIKRRQLRGTGPVFDNTDLPVCRDYMTQLQNMGVRIYRQSRWLNAVSCYLNGIDKDILRNLSFVRKVEPVRTSIYRPPPESDHQILNKSVSDDYGPSFNQNEMIGIPYAHALGFHGEDVLIAVFDTGFLPYHEALQHIKVVATWDFVYNDENVTDEKEDVFGQSYHGTEVLSILAGYFPGKLIGPAYAAQFLLAKTDHLTLETHQDEDNWVAAAEWAEGLGADVISSSVGYILDYTYEDMNGHTTAVTNAADLAVRKGVLVFNSAGNEGLSAWKYIIAPADGDSVITMGAVTPDGNFFAVSSRGPTYDGRIKPDLVAQGQNVYCVDPRSTDRYTTENGTSLSCPLGAGAGAIILSINPTLSPMEVRALLVNFASQSNNPDNLMGYGIINLEKTVFDMVGEPSVVIAMFEAAPQPGRNLIQWNAELEIENEKWLINRRTPSTSFEQIGQLEGREFGSVTKTYSFSDFNVKGGEIFTYQLSAQFKYGRTSVIDTIRIKSNESSEISLLKNFPNPFNSETKIIFGLPSPQKVTLTVYDISGKLVKRLLNNEPLEAQYHHVIWDGSNSQNHFVSSGTYFLRLSGDSGQKIIKMLLLR